MYAEARLKSGTGLTGRRSQTKVWHGISLPTKSKLEAEVFGDHHPLNFICALTDLEDLLVAIEA